MRIDLNKLTGAFPKYDIIFVAVFGSFARGEAAEKSDIDLLVEFGKRKSLLDIVRIERELSELMGNPVDLLTKNSISPHIRQRIQDDLKVIYDKR